MPTLPNADSMARSIPNPSRSLVQVSESSPAAQALGQAANAVGQYGEDYSRKANAMQKSYAESQFLSGQIDALNELRDDPDYETAEQRYDARMKELATTAGKTIDDEGERQMWFSQISPSVARGRGQVKDYARNNRVLQNQATSMSADDQDGKAYLNASSEFERASVIRNFQRRTQVEQESGIWNPVEALRKRREFFDSTLSARAERDIESGTLPPLGGQGGGGFDSSYKVVAQNEGGYAPVDGASGAPAIFGINRKWHPEAFDEAKRLHDSGDTAGAQAYAKDFYKGEYWDKYNLDSIPAGTQDVVLDGVVNHRSDFAKDLADKARDGASREELISMRRDEYERLGKNAEYAPSLDGWNSRLDRIAQGGDSYLAALSPKAYEQVRSKAQAYENVHIRKELTDIDNAASMAIYVPPEKIDTLAVRADRAGLPEYGEELRKYGAVQDSVNVFGGASTKDQNADLSTLRNDIAAGNTGKVDEYTAKLKVFTKKSEMIGNGQGWEYYSMRGVIPAPTAMDITNPQDVAAKLDMRRVDLARVQQIEGAGFNMPILTQTEIDTLDSSFKTGTPEQASAALTAVGSSLNGQERIALARQIAPKNNLLAAALNLDFNAASQVIAGSKMTSEVKQGDIAAKVEQHLSGVIADSVTYETSKDAVYAYYKNAALVAGKTGEAIDQKLFDESINAVVGEVLDITPRGSIPDPAQQSTSFIQEYASDRGGISGDNISGHRGVMGLPSRVFSYRKDDGKMASPEELEDTLGSITDAKLKSTNGRLPMTTGGDFIPTSEIIKRAQWRSAGDGVYVAFYPGFGKIVNQDGTDYLFDARKLSKPQATDK